eukprot:m.742305 g.742305  ORF g.742305 m.742305 type:complete len:84 (-) comp23118_c0_seq7:5-256(-)
MKTNSPRSTLQTMTSPAPIWLVVLQVPATSIAHSVLGIPCISGFIHHYDQSKAVGTHDRMVQYICKFVLVFTKSYFCQLEVAE